MAVSIVNRLAVGGNVALGATSRTLTVPVPSGTLPGDLIVINARLWTSEQFGYTAILGSISIPYYTLVDGFGTPYGYLAPPATRERSLYVQTIVGRYSAGQGPYTGTFTLSKPVAGDASARCRMNVTTIRGVSSWAAGRLTHDGATSPWPLGIGVSDGGVFGIAARAELPGLTNVTVAPGSPGTCTTVENGDGFRTFWDFANTTWTMPTINTAYGPVTEPGAACWLALNPTIDVECFTEGTLAQPVGSATLGGDAGGGLGPNVNPGSWPTSKDIVAVELDVTATEAPSGSPPAATFQVANTAYTNEVPGVWSGASGGYVSGALIDTWAVPAWGTVDWANGYATGIAGSGYPSNLFGIQAGITMPATLDVRALVRVGSTAPTRPSWDNVTGGDNLIAFMGDGRLTGTTSLTPWQLGTRKRSGTGWASDLYFTVGATTGYRTVTAPASGSLPIGTWVWVRGTYDGNTVSVSWSGDGASWVTMASFTYGTSAPMATAGGTNYGLACNSAGTVSNSGFGGNVRRVTFRSFGGPLIASFDLAGATSTSNLTWPTSTGHVGFINYVSIVVTKLTAGATGTATVRFDFSTPRNAMDFIALVRGEHSGILFTGFRAWHECSRPGIYVGRVVLGANGGIG